MYLNDTWPILCSLGFDFPIPIAYNNRELLDLFFWSFFYTKKSSVNYLWSTTVYKIYH